MTETADEQSNFRQNTRLDPIWPPEQPSYLIFLINAQPLAANQNIHYWNNSINKRALYDIWTLWSPIVYLGFAF